MAWTKNRRQTALSWLFVCALFVLCAILGALQYRSIGDLSVATRKDLRNGLQTNLNRLSQGFNAEIGAACRVLTPADLSSAPATERDFAARYAPWKTTARDGALFRRIAFAEPLREGVALRAFDPATGSFSTIDWPPQWAAIRDLVLGMISPDPRRNRGAPGHDQGPRPEGEGTAFEIPLFRPRQAPVFRGSFPRPEGAWMIFDLDQSTLAGQVLPEMVQRHLESGGELDYQVEVLTRTTPPAVIYRSDANLGKSFVQTADASVRLFDPQAARMGGGGPEPMPWIGRWQIYVRHRAGSLEAVVESIRRRNLAVTACILLLLLHGGRPGSTTPAGRSVWPNCRWTSWPAFPTSCARPLPPSIRRLTICAEKWPRTPPRWSATAQLIQQKSGRLKELVEQILQFAGAEAGRAIRGTRAALGRGRDPRRGRGLQGRRRGGAVQHRNQASNRGFPPVLGDPLALKQALENLIGNAAKYGAREGQLDRRIRRQKRLA